MLPAQTRRLFGVAASANDKACRQGRGNKGTKQATPCPHMRNPSFKPSSTLGAAWKKLRSYRPSNVQLKRRRSKSKVRQQARQRALIRVYRYRPADLEAGHRRASNVHTALRCKQYDGLPCASHSFAASPTDGMRQAWGICWGLAGEWVWVCSEVAAGSARTVLLALQATSVGQARFWTGLGWAD